MRKADIEIYDGLPSVNVRTEPSRWQMWADDVGRDLGYPGFTTEWCDENISDDQAQELWEFACASGWDMAQSDAEELFGPRVEVYGEGRSAGHLVVRGLPDVETWDAVMVARWAKFARWARATADHVPEAMCELACINDYEIAQTRQAERDAQCAAAQLPVLLSV